MDNNIGQMNNQNKEMPETNMEGHQEASDLEVELQKPNMLLGTLGALGAVVVSTIVWILISTFTGSFSFLFSAVIAFFAIFSYEKLGKKLDIKGIAICLVITCIGTYFGIRLGYIFLLAYKYNLSFQEAIVCFETNYTFTKEFVSEYIIYMILSYVVCIGYTVAMMFKGLKKER